MNEHLYRAAAIFWKGMCAGAIAGLAFVRWIANPPGFDFVLLAAFPLLVVLAVLPDLVREIVRAVTRYRRSK